ncbi:hypothetical protein MSG28_006054 [Choristoneura fumiferana]|uniref:Uncharacterized protein n=1 Tax=Choristoneura fumiferana TaxID=7141 RepID=A0ACC0JDG9_CHOFU|nr:hypothetical protein MSG28_006054 [Choristoneura fumiferana]
MPIELERWRVVYSLHIHRKGEVIGVSGIAITVIGRGGKVTSPTAALALFADLHVPSAIYHLRNTRFTLRELLLGYNRGSMSRSGLIFCRRGRWRRRACGGSLMQRCVLQKERLGARRHGGRRGGRGRDADAGADTAAGGEFVEGWLVAQVLGEGAYGEITGSKDFGHKFVPLGEDRIGGNAASRIRRGRRCSAQKRAILESLSTPRGHCRLRLPPAAETPAAVCVAPNFGDRRQPRVKFHHSFSVFHRDTNTTDYTDRLADNTLLGREETLSRSPVSVSTYSTCCETETRVAVSGRGLVSRSLVSVAARTATLSSGHTNFPPFLPPKPPPAVTEVAVVDFSFIAAHLHQAEIKIGFE